MKQVNNRAPVILIVDDQSGNLRYLEDILGREEYVIVGYPDGESALAAVEETAPDLILLNIMLNGMNGYEVCTSLKQLKSIRNVPVIFLSNLEESWSKEEAFNRGAVDYIAKPFHKGEILSRIKVHLNWYRMQRQLEEYKHTMEQELKWAGLMQESLVRPDLVSTDSVEFEVTYLPVPDLYCGGDYYDVINLPGDRYLILVGEVSGYGIQAAFITAIMKAVIYPEYIRRGLKTGISPSQFLTWFNNRMNFEMRKTAGVTISLMAGLLDIPAKIFTYSNAGRNCPFVISNGEVRRLCVFGPAVGDAESVFYAEYTEELNPGDMLVAYSEGLLKNFTGLPDNSTPVQKAIEAVEPGKKYHQRLLDELLEQAGGEDFVEDVTLLSAVIK